MLIKELVTTQDVGSLFKKFKEDKYPIILESQKDPEKLGRYSFIMSDPFLVIKSKGNNIEILEENSKKNLQDSPLDILQELLEKYKTDEKSHIPFTGGAAGYLSYDLCHHIEALPKSVTDDINIPDLFLGFYDGVLAVDHLENKKYLIAHGFKESADQIIQKLKIKTEKKINLHQNKTDEKETIFHRNMNKKSYLKSIQKVKDYIYSGDIYQINFTQRFQCKLNKSPYTIYERLRSTNPAPFASYINFGEGEIVCCSPERFIQVREGIIETRPIKGTIARGATLKEDKKNKKILKASEKDKSELLMIVDLERNDIGKISETGSVKVTELFSIEEYSTLFQQVATVTGKLKKNISTADILKATFPGGSITGAPKIRAMEIIDELEPTARNIYTGSIGYMGFDGSIDLNIVIRTILCKENTGYFQVGGGIVWDSDPESEYQESILKGKALKEALIWRE
ncbi:aminodeoxychorismate synthase component I [Ilyobacter polytropus]|uniref:aminodeoxychorismate synthase n=1 Tax=Ilyobacter polytropus (strain ATCC 51220 / DSM 2926 / LMG 16218 / CuHBu1) TaxID=572544 RepID=E3H6D8_ILYPC|nr:aminodeoxychorismate synthase component I [Ilyobacter polytropus]ADO82351.1 aminodeoxychorismate synthase, subunit I [Ilyobacter polytropus DSM 2926]